MCAALHTLYLPRLYMTGSYDQTCAQDYRLKNTNFFYVTYIYPYNTFNAAYSLEILKFPNVVTFYAYYLGSGSGIQELYFPK